MGPVFRESHEAEVQRFIVPRWWDSHCTSSHRPARSRFTSSCRGRQDSRPLTSCRRQAGVTAAASPSPVPLRETPPARWGYERSCGFSAIRGTGDQEGRQAFSISRCYLWFLSPKEACLILQWEQKLCSSLFIHCFCPDSSCAGKGRRRWRAVVGQGADMHIVSWPWAQTWTEVRATTRQHAPAKIRGLSEVSSSRAKPSGKKVKSFLMLAREVPIRCLKIMVTISRLLFS